VKRAPGRPRPIDIVEVPAPRPDPRSADPAATQKISREQLEEALKRTKSGTRRALRSEPELPPNENDPRRERDSLPGPREDDDSPLTGPQVTIVRIDSVEIESIDPLSLPPIRSTPSPPARSTPTPMGSMLSPMVIRTPGRSSTLAVAVDRKRRYWATNRLHITPRAAFIAGLAVALFVLLAAAVGFFAGRIAPGSG
jgi:hypothetical protein